MIAPLQSLGRTDQALLLRAQWRALLLGLKWPLTLNLLAALMLSVLYTTVFNAWAAPLWFGAVAIAVAARIATIRRYGRKAVLNRRPESARAWILGAIGINGIVWGIGAFLLMTPDNITSIAVYCFFVGGMTAGAAASISAAPLAFSAFAVPMLALLTLRLALLGDPLSYLLATVAAVFAIGMAGVAHNSQRQMERALRLWLSNRRLKLDLLQARNEARMADRRADEFDRDRQAALAAAETKSRFLTEVGHEIRTPLNAVIGFSDMLAGELYGALGNEKYSEYANDIRVSGLHLRRLVDGLLDLSLMEQPNWQVRVEYVRVEDVAQRVVRELTLANPAISMQLLIDVEPADLWIEADPRLLYQIVRNLAENAVKHTEANEEVIILGRATDDGAIRIAVQDSGPPIPEAALARIMAPFVQGSESDRQRGGIGLGLALARQFVELHRGRIEIRNTPEGGVIAEAILPRRAARLSEPKNRAQNAENSDT